MNNSFSHLLLNWYQSNHRDLPWRKTKDPYLVWISEIMLQQTRIEAVKPYYERFIKRIPNIASLASIDENELLKLWEGLGYYNRARNLKKAAIKIMEEHNGIFPRTYEEIMKLPGIGEYTASAIASICFNELTPVVDGNVLRVFTRVRQDYRNVDEASTKKAIRRELEKIIPLESGDFNEALMELGETICLVGEPKCKECPLKDFCKAFKNNSWQDLPVKETKKAKKEKFYTVLLFIYKNKYALIQRKEEEMLSRLWQFPYLEKEMDEKKVINYLKKEHISYQSIKKDISYKHVFSHQIWHMQAYKIELNSYLEGYIWCTIKEMQEKYAIPSAFQPFLTSLCRK